MPQAVGSQVIVKLEHEDKVGSIIIPDNAQAQGSGFWGKVIAVGWDCKLEIKEGDRILFFRNEGYEITEEGDQYLSVEQKHIHGIREDDDKAT